MALAGCKLEPVQEQPAQALTPRLRPKAMEKLAVFHMVLASSSPVLIEVDTVFHRFVFESNLVSIMAVAVVVAVEGEVEEVVVPNTMAESGTDTIIKVEPVAVVEAMVEAMAGVEVGELVITSLVVVALVATIQAAV